MFRATPDGNLICLDILALKMYFVNGLKNMYEQLVTIFTSIDIIGTISSKIDLLTGLVDGYLSGANNLRLVSIILMILALILFLFLIIIIYVKTIVAFLKKEPRADVADEDDDIFDEKDAERLQEIIRNQERDMELEKELQKELDMVRAERDQNLSEQATAENKKQKEKELKKEQKRQETEKAAKEEKEKQSSEKRRSSRKTPQIDLDWKKGSLPHEQTAPMVDASALSYHQEHKDLGELLGLIIDMLGRGVDDLKIAQTVMFRNQNLNSEDDILQTIDAIKYFVDLSRNRAFAKLPFGAQLPGEEEALYHLAKGDASLALTLLEGLMDNGIEKAAQSTNEAKRDALYKIISEQACVFGTLAAVNDVMLATGAFELSIELSPNNANAWSRAADMYLRAGSINKATWAYQNAVNFADEEINARELANAHKHLSQHLYDQGNSLQAAKLYNSSKQFYDSLGINRRLDKQEIEIVEIIEAHHNDDLRLTIHNLLSDASRQTA